MFDFQAEKSLPTHENYYVKLNDYFIAYTYIFNVFFFYFEQLFLFLWALHRLLSAICLQSGRPYIHPFLPQMSSILWRGPLWKPLWCSRVTTYCGKYRQKGPVIL